MCTQMGIWHGEADLLRRGSSAAVAAANNDASHQEETFRIRWRDVIKQVAKGPKRILSVGINIVSCSTCNHAH